MRGLGRYKTSLNEAMKAGIRKEVGEGISIGVVLGMETLMAAVSYLFGGYLLTNAQLDTAAPLVTYPNSSRMAADATYYCVGQCSGYVLPVQGLLSLDQVLIKSVGERCETAIPGSYSLTLTCKTWQNLVCNQTVLEDFFGFVSARRAQVSHMPRRSRTRIRPAAM